MLMSLYFFKFKNTRLACWSIIIYCHHRYKFLMHEVLVLCGWLANLRSQSSIEHGRPAATSYEWPPVSRMSPSGCPQIDYASSGLIDSGLTLSDHFKKVATLCYFHHIWQLRIVRRTLTDEVAHSLVRALIHNRIDYCNVILASSPKYLTEKLQSVLRVAARLVPRLPSRSPFSAWMRDQLHWLSVESRVKFKLALLAYKSVHGLAPEYLFAYCVPVSGLPGRSHFRSADRWTMFVPRNTLWQSALRILLFVLWLLELIACVSSWLWFVTGHFQAEIKTSFVYLVILCTSVNLVNCLLTCFTSHYCITRAYVISN